MSLRKGPLSHGVTDWHVRGHTWRHCAEPDCPRLLLVALDCSRSLRVAPRDRTGRTFCSVRTWARFAPNTSIKDDHPARISGLSQLLQHHSYSNSYSILLLVVSALAVPPEAPHTTPTSLTSTMRCARSSNDDEPTNDPQPEVEDVSVPSLISPDLHNADRCHRTTKYSVDHGRLAPRSFRAANPRTPLLHTPESYPILDRKTDIRTIIE
jgi:hypothetical protein